MYALQMLALMRAQELERETRARRHRRELDESHVSGERHGVRERLTSWSIRTHLRRDVAGSPLFGRAPRAEGTIAPACATS